MSSAPATAAHPGRPTVADLHTAVVSAYPDHGGVRWARLLVDAGVTGRGLAPDAIVEQLITVMRTSPDPIMARCGAAQQARQAVGQPAVSSRRRG